MWFIWAPEIWLSALILLCGSEHPLCWNSFTISKAVSRSPLLLVLLAADGNRNETQKGIWTNVIINITPF